MKHGHKAGGRKSPTYCSWAAMMGRCYQRSHVKFPNYGGRGIKVCERWRDFVNFLADMGIRPDGKTLDRRETNGDYELGNCRWATSKQQARNRRPYLTNNARKTHCPRGHAYAGENLVWHHGGRECRICKNEAQNRRRAAA